MYLITALSILISLTTFEASATASSLTNFFDISGGSPSVPVAGEIHVIDGFPSISINGEDFSISGADSDVQSDLNRLEDKDFLYAEGHLDQERHEFVVEIINGIGIAKILGPWVESKLKKLFTFLTFTDLQVSPIAPTGYHSYQYSLVPGDGDSWSLLLLDGNQAFLGFMKCNSQKISIDMIDSATGNVSYTLELTPKPPISQPEQPQPL